MSTLQRNAEDQFHNYHLVTFYIPLHLTFTQYSTMPEQAFFLQEHEMGYASFQLLPSAATCLFPHEWSFILDVGKEYINKRYAGRKKKRVGKYAL
jgi:hypothetical protein